MVLLFDFQLVQNAEWCFCFIITPTDSTAFHSKGDFIETFNEYW